MDQELSKIVRILARMAFCTKNARILSTLKVKGNRLYRYPKLNGAMACEKLWVAERYSKFLDYRGIQSWHPKNEWMRYGVVLLVI